MNHKSRSFLWMIDDLISELLFKGWLVKDKTITFESDALSVIKL